MTLHRGRIARSPAVLNVRPLTRDDLEVLRQPKEDGTRVQQGIVQRLRDPHHRVARLFAAGLRTTEVIERSGYSHSRITTLAKDPAFQELVAKYRQKVDAAFEREQDAYQQVAMGNMLKAETMLAEKLEMAEEDGVPLPVRDLIAISRDAADRFGYGKRQMNLNVNADFASLLEKAIQRSGKTIDAIPSSKTRQSPALVSNPNSPTDAGEPIEASAPAPPLSLAGDGVPASVSPPSSNASPPLAMSGFRRRA